MISVLLIDDHALVRTGIREILKTAGDIEVVAEGSDGEEAVKLVRKHDPDVILMDVNMPGVGGIEATRRVLRVKPDVRVIALTVLEDDPFPAKLHEAGAAGYLTKDSPAEEVLHAIRTVAQGHPYVASKVAQKHTLAGFRSGSATPFEELSAREMQVTLMILGGQKNQEISDSLSLSPKTVSTYRQRIFDKLNIKTDVELTKLAYRHGLIGERT